ncbi:MAG: ferredoxin--NADP reductase [Bacteroidia bacterium]|nr:ferredoxin--NADP reductase [Bacteroidia bacterium]
MKSHLLTVTERIEETADAVTLRFAQPSIDRIPYLAGQYLTFRLDLGGTVRYRSYSISSSPQLDRYLAVTVKRIPGGRASEWMTARVSPGDTLECIRPLGRFSIETASKQRRHLLLAGAGSGITPLYSMLRAVLFHEPQSRVTLWYQNRSAGSVIFRRQLEQLAAQFAGRLDLQHWLSQPEAADQLPHTPGRLDSSHIHARYRALDWKPESAWLCGPPGFREALRQGLQEAGMAPEHIREERFDDAPPPEVQEREGPVSQVTVHVAGQTYQITVPPGATVLEAALSQQIPLPYSCKRGVCSTCMGILKQGQMRMKQHDALLDFEVAAGRVLMCQALPQTGTAEIQAGW